MYLQTAMSRAFCDAGGTAEGAALPATTQLRFITNTTAKTLSIKQKKSIQLDK